jgi:hypothetical protein
VKLSVHYCIQVGNFLSNGVIISFLLHDAGRYRHSMLQIFRSHFDDSAYVCFSPI